MIHRIEIYLCKIRRNTDGREKKYQLATGQDKNPFSGEYK
jgi:hypothetical protein